MTPSESEPKPRRWMITLAAAGFLAVAALLAVDREGRWTRVVLRVVTRLFYEQSALAALREPSQVALLRMHLAILALMGAVGALLRPWLTLYGRRWMTIFAVGYALRAAVWIAGGNLPLVPGDSSHYVEIASSILQGEGPVKHYVESFFSDYPQIRQGRGILDDWATPLYAYLLAGAYKVLGVVPGDSLEATFAVSKGLSFFLNIVTLPVLYLFSFRRYGLRVALGSLAVAAVLPVHVLYAGFGLRESLVALTSLLATWLLTEVWVAKGQPRYAWAVAAGLFAGLAILARNTAMAMAAASGLYGLAYHRRKHLGPMMVWGVITCLTIAPWAWATYREYGAPFHTYTKYFAYNFSWAVHHYDSGVTRASDFYTLANAPEILRVKAKAVALIAVISTMILSLPLVLGFIGRFRKQTKKYPRGDADRLAAVIAAFFVLGTLANVADVTQVQQLGRYFLPLFMILVPSAVCGCFRWLDSTTFPGARRIIFATTIALLWSDPSWSYDYVWLSRTYQLHWPAIWESGQWIRAHPEVVAPEARVMTWFPWEFRLASRRATVLMNRSLFAPHITSTIGRYGVTHLLWGSFEPPPDVDPELWATHLAQVRLRLGLVPSRELYATPQRGAIGTFPVTLYRLAGEPR